jgi:hypothetical protein
MTLPKITGYRQLTEAEAALINEVKAHAEATRDLVNRVDHFLDNRSRDPLPEGHAPHSVVTEPMRWLAMGRADLQTGFMKITRAIEQPTTF